MFLNKLKEIRYVGTMEDARQLWLFSYYCRGMSFVDMANLEQSNIEVRDSGEYIKYRRKKTVSTNSRDNGFISIKINDNIWKILEYFRTRPLIGDYLTPIMTKDLEVNLRRFSYFPPVKARAKADNVCSYCDMYGRRDRAIQSLGED